MQVASLWTSFCNGALDWFYPRKCALCGLTGLESPCATCQSQMVPAEPDFVSEVGGPLVYRACVFAYTGRAAQAVRRLKYSRSTSLSAFMASKVADRIKQLGDPGDVLVPVPIHGSRRSERGFNQAEVCAWGEHGLDMKPDMLRRIRATRPQAGLSLQERERNLAKAFVASPEAKGRDVILIDDVVTSGHTAQECAKALVEAGASSVGIIAFCGNLA